MQKIHHHSAQVKSLEQILNELSAMGLSFLTDGFRLLHKVQEDKLAEADNPRLTDLLLALKENHGQAVHLLEKKGENS